MVRQQQGGNRNSLVSSFLLSLSLFCFYFHFFHLFADNVEEDGRRAAGVRRVAIVIDLFHFHFLFNFHFHFLLIMERRMAW